MERGGQKRGEVGGKEAEGGGEELRRGVKGKRGRGVGGSAWSEGVRGSGRLEKR